MTTASAEGLSQKNHLLKSITVANTAKIYFFISTD